MNRFRVSTLFLATVACIILFGLETRTRVFGQDATPAPSTVESRLAALEAEVAIQREVVASLLDRIKVLEDKLGDANPTAVPVRTPEPDEQPIPLAAAEPTFRIVEVDTRVTEMNNVWWKYAWLLTLENQSSDLLVLAAEIQFLDEDGFVVDDDIALDLRLGAGETKTFRDYVLVDASVASSVDAINALVKVREQIPDPSFVPNSPTTAPSATPAPTLAMTATEAVEADPVKGAVSSESEGPIIGTPKPCQLSVDAATGRTVYVVQAGDSALGIAVRCGISLQQLLTANALSNPDFIFSGQPLIIPLPTIAVTSTPAPTQDEIAQEVRDIGIHIDAVQGVGDLAREHVMVSNDSDLAYNLQGWRIESSDGPIYTFGNVSLFPGGRVLVYTGTGTDTSVAVYWGRSAAVWRSGDSARLINQGGETVSRLAVP